MRRIAVLIKRKKPEIEIGFFLFVGCEKDKHFHSLNRY